MSRFPEPAGSRAVLLGAGRYPSGSGLHALPAVAANLADLAAALTDPRTGTLAPDHCTVVAEPLTPGGIGDAVARAAATATDLLLVYYSGHGLVDDRGRLHLALSTTDPDRLRWTAVPFDVLREEIADSAAAVRVLVLDCCFSGRAIHAMADHHGVITGQIDVAGTYTLTSSAANAPSHAPVGATHTSFTEALLTGLASPEPLTLDELFTHVYGHLAARGLPRPQRRAVNAAGALALSKGSLAGTAPPPAVSRGPRQADRAEPPATPGTGPGPAPSGLSRPDAASPSGPVRAGFVGSELPAPPAASAEAEAEAAPPTRPGRPDAGVGQRAAAGGRRPRPGARRGRPRPPPGCSASR
ncbi:caspase family protein [Actinacidiphila yeochonensis]|uniref:caspase family protein n=1 Tax=Actinacidiphila yeochonensis TaxID=89050 RepID=UPI0006924BC6|nr:caspase family protein [Actinacidiphila yeochonensis]